jgi:hypothetical protein
VFCSLEIKYAFQCLELINSIKKYLKNFLPNFIVKSVTLSIKGGRSQRVVFSVRSEKFSFNLSDEVDLIMNLSLSSFLILFSLLLDLSSQSYFDDSCHLIFASFLDYFLHFSSLPNTLQYK